MPCISLVISEFALKFDVDTGKCRLFPFHYGTVFLMQELFYDNSCEVFSALTSILRPHSSVVGSGCFSEITYTMLGSLCSRLKFLEFLLVLFRG